MDSLPPPFSAPNFSLLYPNKVQSDPSLIIDHSRSRLIATTSPESEHGFIIVPPSSLPPSTATGRLPTLYSFDSKDVLRKIEVGYSPLGYCYTNTGIVFTKSGEPGKLSGHKRQCKPTTVSPTPGLAAKAYAEQKWREKQQVENYRPSDVCPDHLNPAAWRALDDRKWPAVCKSWTDCKDSELICNAQFPWIGQPKVDGDRCMVWLPMGSTDPADVKLFSRSCLEMKFKQEFRKQCCDLLLYIRQNWPQLGEFGLDGELRADVDFHQESRSVVARTVNIGDVDESKLKYIWFDIMEYNMTFLDRFQSIQTIWDTLDPALIPVISISDARVLESRADIDTYFAHCAKIGFPEGIVLRRPSLLYTRNCEHKHSAMVKKKTLQDKEFRVMGYKSGAGNRKGCVVWQCQDPSDLSVMFWCDQIGTIEYQRELYQKAGSYINKLLTVEFISLSKDGKPLHPHGIRFRDPESMATPIFGARFDGSDSSDDN